jgi:hypothetical protein
MTCAHLGPVPLRRYAGSIDTQSITEDDLTVVAELGSTLLAAAD